MLQKSLSIDGAYCMNPAMLKVKETCPLPLSFASQSGLTSEDLAIIEAEIGSKQLSANQIRKKLDNAKKAKHEDYKYQYNLDIKEFKAGKKEIETAFSKMNAELFEILDPNAQAVGYIHGFAMSEPTQKDRFLKSWAKLEEKYAAKASADANLLRSNLMNATDANGWPALMGIHQTCLTQLSQIPFIGTDGIQAVDAFGIPKTHRPEENDLCNWLLRAISDPHLDPIKWKYPLDHTYTYERMVREIEMVYKSNPEWAYKAPTKVLAAQQHFPNSKRSSEIAGLNSCYRCHRPGHFANKCSSTVCAACNQKLPPPDIRHVCPAPATKQSGGNGRGNRLRSDRGAASRKAPVAQKGGHTAPTAQGSPPIPAVGSPSPNRWDQKRIKIDSNWSDMTPEEIGVQVKAALAKNTSKQA